MKKSNLNFILSIAALSILITSCGVSSLTSSTKVENIVHEHQVEAPVNLYQPTSAAPLFLDKAGDLSISVDFNKSGENTNDDPNLKSDLNLRSSSKSSQKINEVKMFSMNTAYAITDDLSVYGRIAYGKESKTYQPYVEMWDLVTNNYSTDYYLWLPLPIVFVGGGHSSEYMENYRRYDYELTRSYENMHTEIGVAKSISRGKMRAQLSGGLGYARNNFEGHLARGNGREVYGSHTAQWFNVHAQPSIGVKLEYFEAGMFLKNTLVNSRVNATEILGKQFDNYTETVLFVEPGFFLKAGPEYCRFSMEYRYLAPIGKPEMKFSQGIFSIGVNSTFNVKKNKRT
ncbi:MAG: hypothetical protein IPI60_17640 [Saprospiraceae bacterium]|nr:hypothetical protein [Saprospiraceae bacterium]